MKELSFYEQTGVVIPGSVLLFGILFFMPEARPLFLKEGITVGGLGLFLLIGYACGHLIASLGNVFEAIIWAPQGGMPSNWVVGPKPRLLNSTQVLSLAAKLKARHGVDVPLATTSKAEWRGHFGLIYRDVLGSGTSTTRIDAFNGNYGLNRGLAVAAFLVAALCAAQHKVGWYWWSGALLLICGLYAARMCRFGEHFGKEVFTRFLLLPDIRP